MTSPRVGTLIPGSRNERERGTVPPAYRKRARIK